MKTFIPNRPPRIPEINGIIACSLRVKAVQIPWPLLVLDADCWAQKLPFAHAANERAALREGHAERAARESLRARASERYASSGRLPTFREHPFLATRLSRKPVSVNRENLFAYATSTLISRRAGPSAEPFFALDVERAILYLAGEIEFIGDVVGPGILAMSATAAWLDEFSRHLMSLAKARVLHA